jgi:N-acetylglutamate synthase-like GNAT family acetyltransferase
VPGSADARTQYAIVFLDFKIEIRGRISIMPVMTPTNYRVRRATVEDLPGLLSLWQAMSFPAGELEKRLTEFQVAAGDDGRLLGTVGFQIRAHQGLIHHEAFNDFTWAEPLRPMFWERIQNLAANHGLFRLWTQEDAPFWKQTGMRPADAESLKKLPEEWKRTPGEWLTLPLRDEAALTVLSADKVFSDIMKAEREQTQKMVNRARTLKLAATVAAIILALFVGVLILYLFKNDPMVLEKLQQR